MSGKSLLEIYFELFRNSLITTSNVRERIQQEVSISEFQKFVDPPKNERHLIVYLMNLRNSKNIMDRQKFEEIAKKFKEMSGVGFDITFEFPEIRKEQQRGYIPVIRGTWPAESITDEKIPVIMEPIKPKEEELYFRMSLSFIEDKERFLMGLDRAPAGLIELLFCSQLLLVPPIN